MPDAPTFERVVVTGGSGFIGQHLLRALAALNCRPVALTRSLADGITPDGLRRQARWVELNLLESDAIQNFLLVERPTVLFHLAGKRIDASDADSSSVAELNVAATTRLLEAARAAGVGRTVIIGTAEEYGVQSGPLSERLPLLPVTAYGKSKAEATRRALAMHAADNFPVVVLRPFSVYGPLQPSRMFVAEAVTCAVENKPFSMTQGTQRRDLVYVDDVARALIAAAQTPGIEGQVFNIGSGRAERLRDVAELIWQLSGSKAPLLVGHRPAPPDETHDTWADISHAADTLGWQPEVELADGLMKTIQWEGAMRQRATSPAQL